MQTAEELGTIVSKEINQRMNKGEYQSIVFQLKPITVKSRNQNLNKIIYEAQLLIAGFESTDGPFTETDSFYACNKGRVVMKNRKHEFYNVTARLNYGSKDDPMKKKLKFTIPIA